MMENFSLPAVNASLNAIALLLLTVGYLLIRLGKKDAHRNTMSAAFVVSCLFLVGYVTNRILVGGMHTEFGGEGVWRMIYYPMLISHIILAIVTVPLVLTSAWLGIRGRITKHRKLVRWTLPIWIYVSITGVLIYLSLY